jgi:hypothetical protein
MYIVTFQTEVFWVVTPYHLVGGYKYFGEQKFVRLHMQMVTQSHTALQHHTMLRPRRPQQTPGL